MTEQEKTDLRNAVKHLNDLLAEFGERYVGRVEFRPGYGYNTELGESRVYVEITKGREIFE